MKVIVGHPKLVQPRQLRMSSQVWIDRQSMYVPKRMPTGIATGAQLPIPSPQLRPPKGQKAGANYCIKHAETPGLVRGIRLHPQLPPGCPVTLSSGWRMIKDVFINDPRSLFSGVGTSVPACHSCAEIREYETVEAAKRSRFRCLPKGSPSRSVALRP
jgi:hypothetical protein